MTGRWRALAVLTAARTSLGFQFQSVASVSTGLIDELGLSFADLGFLIGLYFLPGVFIALPAAAFGRRIGDKRAVMVGLALMVIGGVVTALAASWPQLVGGRLVSGIGAVVLSVLMNKMMTDWFAGREIVLAMSIFANSFPIGVGAAMATATWLGTRYGWSSGLWAAAAVAAAALVLMVIACERHANDRKRAGDEARPALAGFELALVCVAGAIWGIFNGAFSVMFGFAPSLLQAANLSAAEAGLLVSTASWLVAVSVQSGGLIAERWKRPALLMTVAALAWSAALLAMALGAGPPGLALILAGALMGLPVSVILSLPGQVLRPENRAIGMGMFSLWLYAGHGGIPPAAGWIQDHAGRTPALLFVVALVLAMPLLHALFRRGLARHRNE